jgi:hypothetical protein
MSPSVSRSLVVLIAVGAASACVHHAPAPAEASDVAAPAPATKGRNTVTSEAISNSAGQPIEKILADRVAGVRLGRTPDATIVRH